MQRSPHPTIYNTKKKYYATSCKSLTNSGLISGMITVLNNHAAVLRVKERGLQDIAKLLKECNRFNEDSKYMKSVPILGLKIIIKCTTPHFICFVYCSSFRWDTGNFLLSRCYGAACWI